MLNYLFTTTRQWNVGDEFIHYGVNNIVKNLKGESYNRIIHNRNPQVRNFFQKWGIKRDFILSNISYFDFILNFAHYDNSWKDGHSLKYVDSVFFSGSPEWFGGRLYSLYKNLESYENPIIMLGLGITNRKINLSKLEKFVLKKAVITVRNEKLVDVLSQDGIKSTYLPCPALLSSEFENDITSFEVIGLGYSTVNTFKNHKVAQDVYNKQLELYKEIVKRYNSVIICHYIDEFEEACEIFGADNVLYSYDSKDYFEIYSNCQLVISPRVHGCGISSSLGIPNIGLIHDKRGETARGFGSYLFDPSTSNMFEILTKVEELSRKISEENEKLKDLKSKTKKKYNSLLKDCF